MAAYERRRAAAAPVPAGGSGPPEPGRAAPGGGGVPAEGSAADFLLRAGVTAMVREALLKVLEARPAEPVSFLAEYFERLVLAEAAAEPAGPPQRLARALWYVCLAHHSHRTAFDSNAGAAYEVLGCGGRRRAAGVDGRLYSELLRRICQRGAAPAEAAAELLRRVRCRDHEAVPFDVFRYGVLTCCVLLEFAAKADALFAVLGAGGSADSRLCQAVLRALEDALGAGHGSRPARYLEAGSRLGPDRLALAMEQALQERKLGSSMSREEFLSKATALFIAKVKPVE
ncbi:tubulin polyglutamylase complex subunit 1 [Passer domesticus]|uniref:tubulin polyglutamylase complex subunit 1 n=1 Tax=Passer domesticus TaxID=48849 RepID=UPI0030FEA7F1